MPVTGAAVKHSALMDRLRLQSLIQRLARTSGQAQARELLREALKIQLPPGGGRIK